MVRGAPPRHHGRGRGRSSTLPANKTDGGLSPSHSISNLKHQQYAEMNADISERFGRRDAFRGHGSISQPPESTKPTNNNISRYFRRTIGEGAPKWTLRPEIPTFDELSPYSTFIKRVPEHNDAWTGENIGGWGYSTSSNGWDQPKVAGDWGPDSTATDAWDTTNQKDALNDEPNSGWHQNTPDTWDITSGDNTLHQAPAYDARNYSQSLSPSDDGPESQTQDDGPRIPMENVSSYHSSRANGDAGTEDWSQAGTGELSTQERQVSQLGAEIKTLDPPDASPPGVIPTSNVNTHDQNVVPMDDAEDDTYENVVNHINGPWPSRDVYLRSHYLLLREDALRPLREAVEIVRADPQMSEDPTHSTIGIYDQVRICGVTFARRGLGIRVQFSLGRIGKNIHWEQSKRLIGSSLVVLMSNDNARVCKVATVAARTLANLSKNPPELDLFFHRAEDLDIDCAQDWILIEERSGFYEGHRHTMTALQRMAHETFPLSEHLVDVRQDVGPPNYVSQNPVLDLTSIFPRNDDGGLTNSVNILESWPQSPDSDLDKSQRKALHNILTKRVSVIQGPPGTGKTYVSTQALRVMVNNMRPGDPPIIIACHTNHALDQLLRHVAEFEPNFARVGSRTKDKDVIKKRTLVELKSGYRPSMGKNFRAWKELTRRMSEYLTPLIKGPSDMKEVLDLEMLKELGILSELQVESVVEGAKGWVSHGEDGSDANALLKWIGKALVPVKARLLPTLLDYEEIDDATRRFEEVMEQEAETMAAEEDDEFEMLRGEYFMIGDTWTGNANDSRGVVEHAKDLLKNKPDLWKIPMKDRGAVYRYIQHQIKAKIVLRLRKMFSEYMKASEEQKMSRFELDEMVLREQKVIGLTTTGVSKYRPLIASLKPRTILIEEAAETLEAPIIAACMESVQQLILVGDHQQLRPNCHVRALQKAPYHMNISMFERLVKNDIEYRTLSRQRRMHPDIRRLLVPIYGEKVKDHQTVQYREPVPGMHGLRTWFFTHDYPEERDQESSSFNIHEVEMIFGFVQYLRYNDMPANDITILTFYNGQRRRLVKRFRADDATLIDDTMKNVQVVTVDSYQGEENGIVILSLVRSNTNGNTGFTADKHRICVALSRAQRGFYIFGNGLMVAQESWLWSEVVKTMYIKVDVVKAADQYPPRGRIGFTLPLYCARHARRFWVRGPHDWAHNVGGCDARCPDLLPCGHRCPHRCHPFDHANVVCHSPCPDSVSSCGHPCSLRCSDRPCLCRRCASGHHERSVSPVKSAAADNYWFGAKGGPQAYRAYADGGVVQADTVMDADARVETLVDVDDDDNDYDPTLTRASVTASGRLRSDFTMVHRAKNPPGTMPGQGGPSLLDM